MNLDIFDALDVRLEEIREEFKHQRRCKRTVARERKYQNILRILDNVNSSEAKYIWDSGIIWKYRIDGGQIGEGITRHDRQDYWKKILRLHISNGGTYKMNIDYKTGSRIEDIIGDSIASYGVYYIVQKSFKGCMNIRPLLFDIYIPILDICIEWDGECHRTGGWTNNEEYELTRRNKKREYATKHKIRLVRAGTKTGIQTILRWIYDRRMKQSMKIGGAEGHIITQQNERRETSDWNLDELVEYSDADV